MATMSSHHGLVGELFDGNTMQKMWPEEKEMEPLWWWDDGPVEK